jgi:Xaa-Pro aminopeptidase
MNVRTARRREELAKTLRDGEADALLVSSETNIRYLTGFTGDSSTLLVKGDRSIVVSDGRYTTQLRQECPAVEAHIRPLGQAMTAAVAEVAGGLGVRRLAFEVEAVTVADFEDLSRALPTVELRGVRDRVEGLRMIKDDGEVEAIREAIGLAERAFERLRAELRAEMSEKEATDRIEAELRRCGADGASFPPIVAVGANAALPHYRGRAEVRVGDDDFVLIDWGATGPSSYRSDLTRVVVTGKVTPKFEEVYRLVLAAQGRGIAAVRPGIKGREVDAEARSAIEEAGFGPFFDHGLGHGLGLDIHEAPRLRRDCDVTLRPGMVLTIEPGVYLPGWGGVRIEDDVLVTPDGCEVLTRVPKSLDSVRVG